MNPILSEVTPSLEAGTWRLAALADGMRNDENGTSVGGTACTNNNDTYIYIYNNSIIYMFYMKYNAIYIL